MYRSLRGSSGLLPALLLVAGAAVAQAQNAPVQGVIVTGRVTSDESQPVPGANVVVVGSTAGAATGTDGTYTLALPSMRAGQTITITARRIGFQPQSREVVLQAGIQQQHFTLRQDFMRLEEVVVTGVAEATSAKKLTFSVATVSEEQLKEVPASSPVAALQGKVAGARISAGVGVPGSNPVIRLRASTQLQGSRTASTGDLRTYSNAPLLIVDGVITQGSLADINANDIERIEVLKGAAAANSYGSQAANGVIQVLTKRGRNLAENQISITARGEYGQAGITDFVPRTSHHPFQLNPDGSFVLTASGLRVLDADRYTDNEFPAGTYRDQAKEWLQDGTVYNTYLSLGFRRGATNFTTAITRDQNQGVLPMLNGLERTQYRLNIDQGIGDKANISASVLYGANKDDQSPFVTGPNQVFFGLLQAPPDVDLRHPGGFVRGSTTVIDTTSFSPNFPTSVFSGIGSTRGNPLYQLANERYENSRERLLGTFSGRYQPLSWLSLDATYGTDRLNRLTQRFQQPGFLSSSGTQGTGLYNNSMARDRNNNATLNATFSGERWDTRSTTRLTYLYEDNKYVGFNANAGKLNAVDVPDLAVADPEQLVVNSVNETVRAQNYYVTQSLDIRDRYLLSGMVRKDESSLFGADARSKVFYGLSGAWRISEDFTIPGVQELKIRAARGTAGLRPNFLDQYETYSVSGGTFSKQQIGNRDLRPAVQTENEYGINATIFDKFDVEFVRADRNTKDAFLQVPLSSAQSGGFTQQIRNAADISGRTYELSLSARLVQTADWSYSVTLTGDRTRQQLDRLDVEPFRVSTGGQNQEVFYYKKGEPLGIMYGNKLVRNVDDMTKVVGYTGNPADYKINSDGLVILASTEGTPNERPFNYVDASGANQFVIGDVNPDFAFGISNNLRWRGIGLYVLLDGVQGGDIYNLTRQWMYQDGRHADVDQAGKADGSKKATAYYDAGLYNAAAPSDWFVEDGSYARLREVSLSYTLNPTLLSRVGGGRLSNAKVSLIGRNLLTWTSYSGMDPEVTSGDMNFRIDGFRYPTFRQLAAAIELGF